MPITVTKKPNKHEFHSWIQTSAAILSIFVVAGGALIGVFQNFSARLIAAIICAGIICYGTYKRKWWVVGIPLLALVALVGLSSTYSPAPATQPQVSQTSQTEQLGTETPSNSAKTVTQNSTPEPLGTFDFDLKPHDAVDIDQPGDAIISSNQSGASGVNDIFLYTNPVASPRLYISNSLPMVYPSNSNDEYTSCMSKLDENSGAYRYDYTGVAIDTKICFYTSDKNIAYAAITGVDHPNGAEPPRTVTLHVIVWKKQ